MLPTWMMTACLRGRVYPYLARKVDREAAQRIVDAADAVVHGEPRVSPLALAMGEIGSEGAFIKKMK